MDSRSDYQLLQQQGPSPGQVFTIGHLQALVIGRDSTSDITIPSQIVSRQHARLVRDGITWNTQYGSTGCGFVVRSGGNKEAFNQYLIIATCGAEGHVGFIVMRDGEVIVDESGDIYANGIDPLFEWRNDTTNRLVVIGRGDTFTIYTNGTEIDEITNEGGPDKGFVALNEFGYTTCNYDNTWLWLME